MAFPAWLVEAVGPRLAPRRRWLPLSGALPRAGHLAGFMDKTTFIRQLELLSNADWQAVIDGQAVLVVGELGLEIGPAEASNAIIVAPAQGSSDAAGLKLESLAEATVLLNEYYLTHPLTLAGFNRQAERLIREQGAAAFAAVGGEFPRCTLFVDGGEVVAEPPDSPRHRYGVFCELDRPLDDAATEARVLRWLQRCEAYERDLEMNVCRYNC